MALEDALNYDSKVLIEQNINGREIEVAVMGNEKPQASLPGEIVNTAGFYDFESKYVSKDASSIHIPANLTMIKSQKFVKRLKKLMSLWVAKV